MIFIHKDLGLLILIGFSGILEHDYNDDHGAFYPAGLRAILDRDFPVELSPTRSDNICFDYEFIGFL